MSNSCSLGFPYHTPHLGELMSFYGLFTWSLMHAPALACAEITHIPALAYLLNHLITDIYANAQGSSSTPLMHSNQHLQLSLKRRGPTRSHKPSTCCVHTSIAVCSCKLFHAQATMQIASDALQGAPAAWIDGAAPGVVCLNPWPGKQSCSAFSELVC